MTQQQKDRLDRLGEPSAIAAEARLAEGLPAAPPGRALVNDQESVREVSRSSSATLGMVLGFVLIIIFILTTAAVLMGR